MHITERFSQEDINKTTGEKKLQQLHNAINAAFRLPAEISLSNDPVQKLNAYILKQSILAFSFVRHPYTRYN